ncbi:AAA family ATPase [Fulvivirga ulvae]|uniref:AAA family ATPase n=1 Tax=Fulvivirga ulvae TaxID=2904245 RepID=UPI001F3CC513|nr:AAA family ATPase [Fulvivirga ulvae]UII31277.1 AAA family ATPase [Fulvivirga ulvae]
MKREDGRVAAPISAEYIKMIAKESKKAYDTCLILEREKDFIAAIPSMTEPQAGNIEYKPQHVLLHDIVGVFNRFAALRPNQEAIPKKAKLILIYLYEQMQGKDLGELYGSARINEMIHSERFENNITLIRETSFFSPAKEMKDEFILPALLLKSRSTYFQSMASFLTRVAALIAKADNKISNKDSELLKGISEKANSPKILIDKASYKEVPENDSLEIVLAELHELIGMQDIKKNVEDLTNFLKVRKMREEKGLKTTNNSLHAVFMGPPGTGKTTVARMLGRIYKHLGYLEKGHLVETDRAGMVAGYVGQTALKADEIIKSATGGVLFIDEAYSLTSGGLNDFGNEAIEILLKRMEDHRGEMVVVVAGYPDEMEIFIQSNPGLQSRFNRYFEFDHFDVDSLLEIFKLNAKKADFILTEDAEAKLMEILERVHEKRHRGFGNARAMRNLFEKIIERQANRIVSIVPITEETLKKLTEEDIPEILKTVKEMVVFDDEEDKEAE